ncbi:serine protease [Actinoplanes sp. NPDC049802]|uniref:S1 family peptidase n=1 Tax=Actinoplanes sp. NPDC049802 TaxID=3154742 RepID=UPI0033E54AF6
MWSCPRPPWRRPSRSRSLFSENDRRRVTKGNHDLGSGFCLADRIVATAAHVVKDHPAADLTFVTSAGAHVEVERVQVDKRIDTALLWVRRSLAVKAQFGHAADRTAWTVTARPEAGAARLTGTVSAVDHLMTNPDGHDMRVLQLHVEEGLGEFHGYSGSAVWARGNIVGILVEQVRQRMRVMGKPPAANVLYAIPIGRVVSRFRLGVPVRPAEEASPALHLLDTAQFDMDPLKDAMLSALHGRDDGVLAFGLPSVDLDVLMNLCAWLPGYIGETAQKSMLTVLPEVMSIETMERYVTRYARELETSNVVCPISVHNVDTAFVDELWKRIRAACGNPRHRLVVFLAGRPATGFPDHVEELPAPAVREQDIADWASDVVALRRWPSSLAGPWTAEIVKRSSDEGRGLDMRLTYETLNDYIERVRLQPDALLSHLEELELRC